LFGIAGGESMNGEMKGGGRVGQGGQRSQEEGIGQQEGDNMSKLEGYFNRSRRA